MLILDKATTWDILTLLLNLNHGFLTLLLGPNQPFQSDAAVGCLCGGICKAKMVFNQMSLRIRYR